MDLLNADEQQEILDEFSDLINRANASLGSGINVVKGLRNPCVQSC